MEYEEHLRNTLEKVNTKIRMCMILVFGEYIWYLVNILGIWYLVNIFGIWKTYLVLGKYDIRGCV